MFQKSQRNHLIKKFVKIYINKKKTSEKIRKIIHKTKKNIKDNEKKKTTKYYQNNKNNTQVKKYVIPIKNSETVMISSSAALRKRYMIGSRDSKEAKE